MTKSNTQHAARYEELLQLLENRFKANMDRHKGIRWEDVQSKLQTQPEKLASLRDMEDTEGEPDVIGYDKKTNEFIFCDCSPESPKGRRSVCYDPEALESRKQHKPYNSAIGMAAEMGINILSEAEYQELQRLGKFDTKTSSWIKAPTEVRELGGAIFGDRRFGRVFIYHNGAESYYGVRGFRGSLRV
ncbi:DUF4256 domain-containing protein [Sphingobacterium sp. SGG-5]|uniref:DUF4256 domain-containing protein n=1 Tax=Sphingobacterium sp. SGG-5 TaxID=2710881 RepID=UPI0013ED435C|nr:DUF4256 domain-containing protein [Sphingobacterium sp. SGG-5]NGM61291.1 DUF4256 domain-containing protein [Sphingobacterium sp. SGG-5]